MPSPRNLGFLGEPAGGGGGFRGSDLPGGARSADKVLIVRDIMTISH